MFDPLPLLMAFRRMMDQENVCEVWLGARIEISDERPGQVFLDISDSKGWEVD